MYLKTKGLILRETPYKDTDALLTLLTGEYGKLTVKARGLHRRNCPLTACCQLLAYGEFTLFEYKGMYTVNEGTALSLFAPIRKDIVKLSLGTYFAQVADVLSQEDAPNPALLSLTLNCLYAMSETEIEDDLIKAVFELRSACIAGYMPELTGCRRCGNTTPDRFDTSMGCTECSGCRSADQDGIRMPITPGMLSAMRYICSCDSKKLFSFSVDKHTSAELSRLTETYLLTQLEHGFSTLDFYKSLLV